MNKNQKETAQEKIQRIKNIIENRICTLTILNKDGQNFGKMCELDLILRLIQKIEKQKNAPKLKDWQK